MTILTEPQSVRRTSKDAFVVGRAGNGAKLFTVDTLTLGITIGGRLSVHSFLELRESFTPITLSPNAGKLYAKDVGGVPHVFWQDDAGTNTDLVLGGMSGAEGPMGVPGIQGEDGEQGEPGWPGPIGPSGLAGAPGATGPMGYGIPGEDGEEGEPGLSGFPGAAGAPGATGTAGPKGYGIPGEEGEDGEPGWPGIRGEVGAPGSIGAAGPMGFGIPGEDGEEGEMGLPGRGATTHALLTDVTVDQHHARSHGHSTAADGGNLISPLILYTDYLLFELSTTVQIDAGGTLTIPAAGIGSGTQISIEVNGGAASTDDLEDIAGAIAEGQFLVLRPTSGSRTIVIKHGVGNIRCLTGSDIYLDEIYKYAFALYDWTSATWNVGMPAVGATGPQGPPGADGDDGEPGLQGTPGPAGAAGVAGSAGAAGAAGTPGFFGIPGDDGEDGEMGWPGPAAAGGGGGTLDTAYDFGGAGAGRVINIDATKPVIFRTDALGLVPWDTDILLRLETNNAARRAIISLFSHNNSQGSEINFGTNTIDAGDGGRIRYIPLSSGEEAFWFDLNSSDEAFAITKFEIIAEHGLNLGYPRGGSGGNTTKTLTASVNNWNLNTDVCVVRIDTTVSSVDITGIDASLHIHPHWKVFIFYNVGLYNAVFKHNSSLSSLNNRFAIGADFTLQPGAACMAQWDDTSSKWRILGTNENRHTHSGMAGIPGEEGEEGEASFIPGPTGATGATGDAGAAGAAGAIGPAGLLGFSGDDGEEGEMGWPGLVGATGPQGPPGSDGSGSGGGVGFPGEDGEDGEPSFINFADPTQYLALAGRSGGQLAKGGVAASENLTLQSTDHATRGFVRAIDELIASTNLTVGSLGTLATPATGAILTVKVEGARLTAIDVIQGSGSWPTVAGGGLSFMNVVAAVNAGTAGTAAINGLYFNPSIAGVAIDTLHAVAVNMAMANLVAANEITAFRHNPETLNPTPFSVKKTASFSGRQFHSGGCHGGFGYFASADFDPVSGTRATTMSVLNTFGMKMSDIAIDQRASERAFGIQMDLFDGSANGVQWPFYYGDFTQVHPTVFRTQPSTAYTSAVTLTVNIPSVDTAYAGPELINGAIDAVVTTVVVDSGATIENNDIIKIDSEMMKVTAGGGTTSLTVIRGVAGSTAASHADNAAVLQSGTAFTYTSAGDNVVVSDVLLIDTENLYVTVVDTTNNILTVTRAHWGTAAAAHAAAVAVTKVGNDNTTEAATAGGTAFQVLSANTADYHYIGTTSPATFRRVLMVLSLPATAADLALVWEYWNGAAWTALVGLSDDTAALSRRGSSISFIPQADWAANSVNGTTRFWIRVSNTSAVTGSIPTCLMMIVDTDNHIPQFGIDKTGQPWIGGTPTAQAVAAGSAYHTSTTETVIHTAVSIPANVLEAGSLLRVTARGVYSTDAVLAPTLQMRIRWGGVAGTVLGDSTALATILVGAANRGWEVSFLIRVVSIGATGTMEGQGWFQFATTASAALIADMENTAVITVDTTLDKDLVLTADWGTSDVDNTLICRQFVVERLA